MNRYKVKFKFLWLKAVNYTNSVLNRFELEVVCYSVNYNRMQAGEE